MRRVLFVRNFMDCHLHKCAMLIRNYYFLIQSSTVNHAIISLTLANGQNDVDFYFFFELCIQLKIRFMAVRQAECSFSLNFMCNVYCYFCMNFVETLNTRKPQQPMIRIWHRRVSIDDTYTSQHNT